MITGFEPLLFLFLFLIACVIRWLPVRNISTDYDTYYYILSIEEVRKQRIGFYGSLNFDMKPYGTWEAPYCWQWIFSRFPSKIVRKYHRYLNGFIDAIFALFIYGLVLYLGYDAEFALAVFFVYLFTPMWFSSLSLGPRVNSLTPRLFSEIACNLLLVLWLLPLGLPLWLVYLATTVITVTVILSSKFGIQFLLFVVPLLSLFLMNPHPVIIVILSFLLTMLVTKGAYKEALREQFHHLANYYRKNRAGEMPVSGRNSLRKLRQVVSNGKTISENASSLLNYLIKHNSFSSVLFKMPILLAAFVLFLMGAGQGDITVDANWMYPVIAATVLFVMINIPSFLFLGEAERYLNHVALFIIVSGVLLAFLYELEWLVWSIIGYGALYWFIESFFGKYFLKQSKKRGDDEIIELLNGISEKQTVLCYPYHAVGVWRILLETNHSVVYPPPFKMKELTESFEKFTRKYPFLELNRLDELVDEFGVSFLIADKEKLQLNNYKNWIPEENWQQIAINSRYIILSRK